METELVLLSRLQFAFTVTFHIIFPSLTIGLAAWLATLEGLHLFTGNADYRRVFNFWIKLFAVSFGMGVVFGIVMAFQFGTNWSVLSGKTGNIQGPLLAYEVVTAFLLEATFLGVVLFGRDRLPPWAYFLCCCMVAIGTTLSAFWIMVNNTWMQTPVGFELDANGYFLPTSWYDIIFSYAVWMRFPHMLFGAYLTTCFVAAATGAWFLLQNRSPRQAKIMVTMALGLAAVLVPVQMVFGHLNGTEINETQPAKLAAIEARWETQQPASLTIIGIPLPSQERNILAIDIPVLGSCIDAGDCSAEEPGLKSFPPEDRPPVVIPFFTFRIMVGMGVIMLAVAWYGMLLQARGRLYTSRWFLWVVVACFPVGWIAVIAGWYTAEVGRQPWVVYNHLRTEDAHSPLTLFDLIVSLAGFVILYLAIVSAGAWYMLRMVRYGPQPDDEPIDDSGQLGSSKRPLAVPRETSLGIGE
ncbi:cytochrome ubiquinol oxidase subunit I [Marinibaculum pumilum]|uniref:Cytochrome ubiquinol oxidase subunit I n=1 Tax=Marinibaculum pumilum TaxID=1766165 RepID=A0ABV7L7I7_9PROT